MAGQAQTGRFAGKRALVMGLGVHGGGLGVARFLALEGADVTVTDLRDAGQLAAPMTQLADLPIRYVLGNTANLTSPTPISSSVIRRCPASRPYWRRRGRRACRSRWR